MDPLSLVIALATGIAGARACAVLAPGRAPRGATLWFSGAIGGVIASVLAATVLAAERSVSLPPTAVSGGIDLAAILGNAAAGALGGIVLALFVGVLLRFVRER